jgi:hypothetical protein
MYRLTSRMLLTVRRLFHRPTTLTWTDPSNISRKSSTDGTLRAVAKCVQAAGTNLGVTVITGVDRYEDAVQATRES